MILVIKYNFTKNIQIDLYIIYHIKLTMRSEGLLLTITILLVTANVYGLNFCQVESPQLKVFTTQRQIQKIPLNKYIRGYNLNFTTTNQTVVAIFEPYHVIQKGDITIKTGYTVVNVDGKNSNSNMWSRHGILFSQGGEKNVSVGYGEFASGVLPKIQGYTYYELPYASECYVGLIYNQNSDVVIDCEKIAAKKEDMSDLVCVITRSGKLNCKQFSPITRTSKRKSVVFSIGEQKFLLSATLTDHISSQFQNQTYLTIYHIVDQRVDFSYIVDRRTLGLDFLSITDIDIIQLDGEDYILLTDANSRLVIFTYHLDNTVDNVWTIPIDGVPKQFQETAAGTWLIAVQKFVLQCSYDKGSASVTLIRKYELDPTDNKVVDIQSSYLFLTVRTFLGRLYTYDRQYPQLKYLLNQQQINQHTAYVVSPFYPRIFQVNSTMMVSIAISSGYLFVSEVQQSTDVIIIGNSGNTSCVFNVRVEVVTTPNRIYQKQNFSTVYRLGNNQPAKFVLSDYFGGSNLRYNLSASKDIKYDLQHINTYKQNLPNQQADRQILFTVAVDIDAKTYWVVQFSTVDARFYKCTLQGDDHVTCKQSQSERFTVQNNRIFNFADGILRRDGTVIVSWTFSNGNQMYIKKIGSSGYSYIIAYPVTRFNQVVTAQKYIIFVQKQLNRLSIYNGKILHTFTKDSFTAAQLQLMGGGFYPRQVSASFSHHNDHIFYIKLPMAILTISYQGGAQLQILKYNKISDTFIQDDLWTAVVGKQSLLLFTPDQVVQYAVLADASLTRLHKISLQRKPIFPVRYQVQTDTAYFQCQDHTIQYIRLNQPALDSQYYNIDLKNRNGRGDWDVSGSWLITRTGQSYYQFEEPVVVITSVVPDTVYREDLSVKITVSSQNQKKDVTANVTAFNYPVKIQASSYQDNGITLPEKTDDLLIPIPIDKYFIGSVASYKIICPYCLDQGKIKLIQPINKLSENTQLSGFDAIVGLQDNFGAIALKQNSVYLLNLKNKIIFKTDVDTNGQCVSLGVNQANLVVFCMSSSNQQIVLFSVTDTQLTLIQSYFVPSQALLIKPSQINVYRKGNSRKVTVFIHDVDLMEPGAKDSNIKVFELAESIQYKTQIDTSTFGIPNSEPINSMSIHRDQMLVTIGDMGLGYLNLGNYSVGQFIDLQRQPALINYTLDQTSYLRVNIYLNNQQKDTIQALVTTSNTFNYLLELKINFDGKVSFSRILETYKRYGHQKCLNWGLIDQRFVMIAYYNSTTSVETLALYKRNRTGLTDFFTSLQFIVPEADLQIPKAALLHSQTISQKSSLLYMNNQQSPKVPSISRSLNLYNVTSQFYLKAKYDKPSSFSFIQVTASNDYYSVSREIKVQFQGNSDGVKWYSIVIVVVLVSIAVGVAFGFYLKMKKKKADSKKVSLFTENQEIDEEV